MQAYDLGVQSVVYKEFSLAELLAELDDIDLDYLELWDCHLSPEDDEATVEEGVA
ncbi:sugar phosphate isomerase/epimerase, partial [Halobacteriales archaeon QH_1_68_42]